VRFGAREHRQSFDAAIDIICRRRRQPLQLHANNQLDAAQLAANGILPLSDVMGDNGFIAVDFDAEEGSSSRRDTIAVDNDLIHKDILRPNAIATVTKLV
jgi:hypothetical protein